MRDFGPVAPDKRIAVIDQIRGLAVLGLVYMLAIAYGLQHASFYRLDIDSTTWLDWVAGVVGQVFFDLKASALAVLVLGAGLAHFMERARTHGKNPKRLAFWRVFLLFLVGVQPGVHAPLWEGNYHLFVAVFSTFTVLMFKRSAKTQLVVGAALVIAALACTPLFQSTFPADGYGLDQYWWPDSHPFNDPRPFPDVHPTLYFIATISLRVTGTTLVGSALYRLGIIQGLRSERFYRRLSIYGFLIGLPLSVGSIVWMNTSNYDPTVALNGHIPNAASAIPLALAYLSLIVLWNKRVTQSSLAATKHYLQAVGQMALTNSIVYVVAGTFIIREGFGRNYFSRSSLVLIVLAVCGVQLVWSKIWLTYFSYGPFEWLLRVATYRRLLPFIRPHTRLWG